MKICMGNRTSIAFSKVNKGDCFRLVQGEALYIKCGDDYTTHTNAVNLCNGNKQKICNEKEVFVFPEAVVHSGNPSV